jgi:hypothetical protein
MIQRPFSGIDGPKTRGERDYTKFRRRVFNAYVYQQDLKPPIFVQPDCFVCGRTLSEHPSYPRSAHPIYGKDCPYKHVH